MAGSRRYAGGSQSRVSPWHLLVAAGMAAGLAILVPRAGGASAEDRPTTYHAMVFGQVSAQPLALSFTADKGGIAVLDVGLALATWRLGAGAPDTVITLEGADAITGPVTLIPVVGVAVMVGRDGRIVEWSTDDGRLRERRECAEPIVCSAVDPASGAIATAHPSGVLRIWDLSAAGPPRELATGYFGVTSLVFLPSAGALCVASGSRGVEILDGESGVSRQAVNRRAEVGAGRSVTEVGVARGFTTSREYAGKRVRIEAVHSGEWLAVTLPTERTVTWRLVGDGYRKVEAIKEDFIQTVWDARGRWLSGFLADGRLALIDPRKGDFWQTSMTPATMPALAAADEASEWLVYITHDRRFCAWRWVEVVPGDQPDEAEAPPVAVGLMRSARDPGPASPSIADADSLAIVGFEWRGDNITRVHAERPTEAAVVPRRAAPAVEAGPSALAITDYSLLDADLDGRLSPGERLRLTVRIANHGATAIDAALVTLRPLPAAAAIVNETTPVAAVALAAGAEAEWTFRLTVSHAHDAAVLPVLIVVQYGANGEGAECRLELGAIP